MKQWFAAFVEKLAAVSATGWILIGLLMVTAAVLTVLLKKNKGKSMTALVWILAVCATAAVLWFASPAITIEEGANTSAGFLYNPVFWSVIISMGGIVVLFLLLRKQEFTTRMLSTGALCVALAFILSCITIYRLPEGGSITPASMLPIFVFAYLYGPVPGIAAGTVFGVLQIVQGAYIVHPVQFLLDYIFPFAALGLAGLFRKEKQLPLGILSGAFIRFSIHVVSGVVFFYMYAPPGQNVWIYSILYNGSFMLWDTVICLAVSVIPGFSRAISRLKAASA